MADECEVDYIVLYKGTKREHKKPLLGTYNGICKTHGEPLTLCRFRAENAVLKSRLLAAERERDFLAAQIGVANLDRERLTSERDEAVRPVDSVKALKARRAVWPWLKP
jgi:hypothetical protein